MTNDCVVCDGLVGCEFCPAGWVPPEDDLVEVEYVDGEWCGAAPSGMAFNLGRPADKHEEF